MEMIIDGKDDVNGERDDAGRERWKDDEDARFFGDNNGDVIFESRERDEAEQRDGWRRNYSEV